MVGLFTVLAVIAAGAASVYFINSSMGMQLIRNESVSTILKDVKALRSSAPQTPLHEIYRSLAEDRAQKNTWLTDVNYVHVYGMPDVSTRQRHHNLSNSLSSWRAWRKRSDFRQVRWRNEQRPPHRPNPVPQRRDGLQ